LLSRQVLRKPSLYDDLRGVAGSPAPKTTHPSPLNVYATPIAQIFAAELNKQLFFHFKK